MTGSNERLESVIDNNVRRKASVHDIHSQLAQMHGTDSTTARTTTTITVDAQTRQQNLLRSNLNTLLSSSSSESMSINALQQSKSSQGLGSIQFTVEYVETLLRLRIHLISGTSLAARDSNGLSDPYVKIHLLPGIAKVSASACSLALRTRHMHRPTTTTKLNKHLRLQT